MKKKATPRLTLHRETLRRLTELDLGDAAGRLGTLTLEGSCGPTTCPCPGTSDGGVCLE